MRKRLLGISLALALLGCAVSLGKTKPEADEYIGFYLAIGNARAGDVEGGELSTSFVEVSQDLFCTVEAAVLGYLKIPLRVCGGETVPEPES